MEFQANHGSCTQSSDTEAADAKASDQLELTFHMSVEGPFCPCGWDGQSVNIPHGGACCCSNEYGDDCKYVHGMGYCPNLPYEPSYDHNPAVCCYDPSVMEFQADHGQCTQAVDSATSGTLEDAHP